MKITVKILESVGRGFFLLGAEQGFQIFLEHFIIKKAGQMTYICFVFICIKQV